MQHTISEKSKLLENVVSLADYVRQVYMHMRTIGTHSFYIKSLFFDTMTQFAFEVIVHRGAYVFYYIMP